MSDDPPVTALMTRAANGDKQAWDALVERYAPLVWSICRRYQLSGADADDLGLAVWLQLAGQLGKIPDPAALACWLATSTRRECAKVLRAAHRPQDAPNAPTAKAISDDHTEIAEQELQVAQRHAALREAFARLPPCCQQLISLLTEDPPVPNAQISAKLDIPAGNIRPYRSRCLDKLRRDPAIAALLHADAASTGRQAPQQVPTQQ
jgi:RNA polymerase sigma factor (sigma-70 family)